jgi:protein-tyrosine kinase
MNTTLDPDVVEAINMPTSHSDRHTPDRPIGAILGRALKLPSEQIDEIVAHQRERGLRFGEAAVELRLATNADVIRALSQQFDFPCVTANGQAGSEELVMAQDPFGEQADVFRELRSQLLIGVFSAASRNHVLAIVSPNSGDGKTYLAANLAVAFSQLGGRTVLVDADLRTPRQHQIFSVQNGAGLGNILAGRSKSNVIHQVKGQPGLFVLPVGGVPPNPLELLQRPAMGLLLHELSMKFDHVLVDTPASERGADARVIAARCGAALVVGRKGQSRMAELRTLIDGVAKSSAAVAGVVMNEF